MFPTQRQDKLNPILASFRKIPGVACVLQDDFDSSVVVVYLMLDDCNSRSGSFNGSKSFRFLSSIRSVKNNIAKACRQAHVDYIFTNQPELKYISSGTVKVKDGYDTDTITVEIMI